MKKALVVDWLDKYGGAERVIGSLEKIFSFDITYSLINVMKEHDLQKIYIHQPKKIEETPAKIAGKNFRLLFFTFHYFIQKIKVDPEVDLIISSSHSVAKGIKKSKPEQLHISYFQARNFNYIWSDYALFFGILRYLFFPLIWILRRIDVRQAQRPDYIVCNSVFVKNWVKKHYERDAAVIYPPVDLSNFPLETQKSDYYVAVGRLVSVKRFDIAIKAFNDTNRKLIIIGDGDQYKNLKNLASDNIIFTGFLDSVQVSQYIQKAKGFIQTGIEGFGIAPIEAQSCGTPVIAYGIGGVLETVISQKTGIFFEEQTVHSLKKALENFEDILFEPIEIRKNALKFSTERFENEMTSFVEDKLREHKRM